MSGVVVPSVEIISYASVHDKAVQEQMTDGKVKSKNQKKQGVCGLTNMGNSCYMNAALQCLANTPALSEYFQYFPWESELNRTNPLGAGGKIAEEYGKLIADMNDPKNTIVTPKSFKKALGCFQFQFNNTKQQDVQELLSILLDGLHEDLNRVLKKPYVPELEESPNGKQREEAELAVESWRGYLLRNRSIVVDIFQGQLRNVLKCLTCSHKSLKFDPYMYMSVPCNEQTTTLSHCLAEFCKPEILSAESQWCCPKCKKPRDAEKKLDLWIAPPIFIVHLKRFMNTNGKRSKINSLIDFPLTDLNLNDFTGNKTGSRTHLYNLYGVANHHGSLGRGHYTAFARNQQTDKWYKFNDTKIHEISESNIVTESAYVLFYSKVCASDPPATEEFEQQNGKKSKNKKSWVVSEEDELIRPPTSKHKMLTVDMIRRQSITIPHHWPHNVSRAFTSASPLDSFEGHEEEKIGNKEGDIDDMPRPSFYSSPETADIATSSSKKLDASTCNSSCSCGVMSAFPHPSSATEVAMEGKKKRKYVKKKKGNCDNDHILLERKSRCRGPPERYA